MIILDELTLRNFMSFGNNTSVFNFASVGSTLILGKDTSTNGCNGVGKSTIYHALLFVLYGKTASGLTAKQIINNINKKNCEVSLRLTVKGEAYTIVRQLKCKNAANKLTVHKGDDDITRDSIANTLALIVDIVGMDYGVF